MRPRFRNQFPPKPAPYLGDRSCGPDADREGQHGHGREAGVLQHLPKGEFEITPIAQRVPEVRNFPLVNSTVFVSLRSGLTSSSRTFGLPSARRSLKHSAVLLPAVGTLLIF